MKRTATIVLLLALLFLRRGSSQPSLEEVLQGVERYTSTLDAAENLTLRYERTISHPPMERDAFRRYGRDRMVGRGFVFDIYNYDVRQNERHNYQMLKSVLGVILVGSSQQNQTEYLLDRGAIQITQLRDNGELIQRIRSEGQSLKFENPTGEGNVRTDTRQVDEHARWNSFDLLRWREGFDLLSKRKIEIESTENGNAQIRFETIMPHEEVTTLVTLTFQQNQNYLLPVQYRLMGVKQSVEFLYSDYGLIDGVPVPKQFSRRKWESERVADPEPVRQDMIQYRLLPDGEKDEE